MGIRDHLAATGTAALLFGLCLSALPAAGQIPRLPPGMSAQEAARLAQERPELGNLVRDRLLQSGLSANEIRARLRSAGMPAELLDAYLSATGDAAPLPDQDVFEAISVLGITTFTVEDSLLLSGDTVALRLYADSVRAATLALEDLAVGRPLELFGLSVFRQPTTQFQPLVTGPVPPSYRIGPGDGLVLILTGDVEIAHALEVTRDGFVFIPDVGQIFVNNLSLQQFETVLRTRLGSAYSGIRTGTTRFDITVSRVRVNTVRVIGEVTRPGSYQLAATASMLAALYDAGGPTRLADFRNVQIRRAGALVASVDLYDYLLRGQTPDSIRLESGDVVFVPAGRNRVIVAGQVGRPAIYQIRSEESLRDVIAAAGGVTPTAHLDAVTITRVLPPEQAAAGNRFSVLTADLAEALRGDGDPVPLFDGDSITVLEAIGPRRNAVSIAGSVWQPGTYELRDGMRLWDLVQAAGGLRPETYSGRAQLLRLRPDSTRYVVGVTLAGLGAPPPDNPPLQESDSVTVFSRTEFRPTRQITVHGAVLRPGLFSYSDSMTLRDAVLLAGGVRDDAYLVEAEVSRVRDDVVPGSDSLAVTFKVPLDSSFVFDPTSQLARRVGATTTPDVLLRPYDNVFVRVQPGLEVLRNVVVTGEVRFPGRYTLLSKQERLGDLIGRAGGLTPQAYANGIRFFRPEGRAGRVSIDLPGVLASREHKDNVVLTVGDSIHIPQFIPTVRVEGAVLSPASVTYVPGADTDYYIDAAGGFVESADKGRTFVQQPNGLIQKKRDDPEPGATVVVPAKDPDEAGIDFAVLLGGIAQILSALTTIILILQRV